MEKISFLIINLEFLESQQCSVQVISSSRDSKDSDRNIIPYLFGTHCEAKILEKVFESTGEKVIVNVVGEREGT